MNLGLGLGLTMQRSAVTSAAYLPSSAAASFAALTPTFDIATETVTPVTVTTVAPLLGTGYTYTLVGAQSAGFDVVKSGENAVIRLRQRRKMLDQGIRQQLLKSRTFVLHADNGAVTADCTVTLTLTTTAQAAMGYTALPGLDVATGRTSTNALKSVATEYAAGRMTGWTVSGTSITIAANNPTALVDFDFRGYRVFGASGFTGGSITQSYAGPTLAQGTFAGHLPLWTDPYTSISMSNITFDMDGGGVLAGWDGMTGAWAGCSSVAILSAQNDGMNPNGGTISNLYISTDGVNKYDATGAAYTDTGSWGHCDGIQAFGMTAALLVDGVLITNDAMPYTETATIRTPAGTAAFTSGSATVTGTGTTWSTGSAANKLNVGDVIRTTARPSNVSYVVTAIAGDTSITIGQVASSSYSGVAILTMPLTDARSGVTAPLYMQGVPVTGTLSYNMTAQNGIVLGGGYALQTQAEALGAAIYNNKLSWLNLGVSEFAFAAYRSDMTYSGVIQGCKDAFTGVAVTDFNPLPTAPTVTQGTTGSNYITLAYTSQSVGVGPAMVYEHRWRLSGGVYGGWLDVPGNKQITGLSASSAYDIEVRGKNCLLDSGIYAQVGTAASVTFSTIALPSYQTETTTLLASFTNQPITAEADAMDAAIVSLKSAGIWAKTDVLYFFADNDAQRVSKNWKTPGTYDISVVGSPTLHASKRGYTSWSSSNYLSTGYKNWFTGSLNALQNSHGLFAWRSDNASGNHWLAGNARCMVAGRQFAANSAHRDSNTGQYTPAVTRSDGLWGTVRSGSTVFNGWGNATGSAPTGAEITDLSTSAVTSAAGQDSIMLIGAGNSNTAGGTTVSNACSATTIIPFVCMGAALSGAEILALDGIVYTYLNTLGRL